VRRPLPREKTLLTLIEMLVACNGGSADVTEHCIAARFVAPHLVAPGFLHTSLGTLGALSDQRVAHGFLYRMSVVEYVVLCG
jgi:hypothetical protein